MIQRRFVLLLVSLQLSLSYGVAPVGWVHIQKLLLPLFENVCEESTDPVVMRLNDEFKLDPSYGVYLKPDVIDNLQNLKANKGLLAKGVIFTEYDADHLNELKIIYEVLYYAKDFDTFYKAASWARQNVNCGLFVDAIYMAILNRRDTEKVLLPAPYELLPNYFIRKDFIIKASSLIRGETISPSDYVRNEGNSYILDVNYTTNYYDDGNDKLAYFHEDIGLNSYYYLNKLKKLPWVTELRILQKTNYGEHIYHSMKQMMARYNLERYSNGLFELEGIDWDYVNEYSYDPMLIYSNGNDFSQRKEDNNNNEILTMLKNIENNLQPLVAHMRDPSLGYNKSEILNHLMEVLVTGEKSYENLALQFLNGDKPISSVPSVLDHYMTTLRDPIFWKLNKKIVDLVDMALQVLPSYTTSQLYFPGVEVQNIEMKKLMTTFDNFEFDVTNALKSEGEDTKFKVKINQPRLNHKPFSFKITVSSQVAQKSLVKIYLGPKVMPGELVEKKNMFMLLDCFEYSLKIGSNLITRTTNDMINLSDDFTSLETIHKKVLDAEFGIDTLVLKSMWSQMRFPCRLILPKGTPEGLPLHVFVFVAPYVKANPSGPRNMRDLNLEAILSPGYPLDLGIEIQQLFNLPNALVKDIVIMHKAEGAVNKGSNVYNTNYGDKVWQSSDNEYVPPSGALNLPARPEFTKRTFDYKSKNDNQYGKRFDYASREDRFNKDEKDQDSITKDDVKKNLNDEKEFDNLEMFNPSYDDKVWQSSDIELMHPSALALSARPEFTKRTFDFKSKNKNQYGKKFDYASRKDRFNQDKKDQDSITKNLNDEKEFENLEMFNPSYDDKVWQSSDIELMHPSALALSARPEFTKKTFDYKSKNNNQYGKKFDYASRKDRFNQDKKAQDFIAMDDVTNKNDEKEPENLEVINNIYINPELEHDKSDDIKIDKHDIYYKISPDNLYNMNDNYYKPSDLIDSSIFDKVIKKEDLNVKPNRLLRMPKKRFFNIFNIVFKPVKPEEEMYE